MQITVKCAKCRKFIRVVQIVSKLNSNPYANSTDKEVVIEVHKCNG